MKFRDRLCYDSKTKTVVSVRDGVLEYYGSEIDVQPYDKIFKVYRSPETVRALADKMRGIPITNEHIDIQETIPEGLIEGSVTDSVLVELSDTAKADNLTTSLVRNRVNITDKMIKLIADGKREASLGYLAELAPHAIFDFEQVDIIPHHLAVVDSGRCGGMCTFLDKKKSEDRMFEKEIKSIIFTDEKSAKPNLKGIMEVVNALPDAIANLPIDELARVAPKLQDILQKSKANDESDPAGEDAPAPSADEMDYPEGSDEYKAKMEADKMEDGEPAPAAAPAASDDPKKDDDEKANFKDSSEFTDAVKAQAKAITDQAMTVYSAVRTKAPEFLPDTYDYSGKSALVIMKDAVAANLGSEFSDEEIPVAFKALKKTDSYQTFGDAAIDGGTAGSFAKTGDADF